MDREQVCRWWQIFSDEKSPTEVRVIGSNTNYILTGYYMDINNVLRDIEAHDRTEGEQIYFTINKVDPSCYSRTQRERLIKATSKIPTTADNDIVARKWVLIDLDTEKRTGISSSDAEVEAAHRKAAEIFDFLKKNGFNEPVVAMSGNGYHLLYRCDMPITQESNEMVKRFLQALNMIFTTETGVKVDEKVFNPARICKLYGTTAKKGSNTPDRPHRVARLLRVPETITPTPTAYFERIANWFPEESPTPSSDNQWGRGKFDVREFLNKHCIQYREQRTAGGTKFILDHCAFDPSHKGKDAMVFQRDNGALAYVCLHDSCSHYHWKDFRLLYEPDAYDKKTYKESREKIRYNEHRAPEPVEETEEMGKKWLEMQDIAWVDVTKLPSIQTGYWDIDKRTGGLLLGDVTVISGTSGSGKTSWIDCICLNAADKGVKVAVWSGELQDFRFKSWLMQIAAGKVHVRSMPGIENGYYVEQKKADIISRWLADKIYLYNNNYGNKWSQLSADIEAAVNEKGVQLVVIDNLMALNLDGGGMSSNEKQTALITSLKELAKKRNIHVILVCHPRKEIGFLRKESISGTADLTNLCDNLFIIHRVGKDFEKRAGEFFEMKNVKPMLIYGNVVEICKNRALGVMDVLTGLYYQKESRRLTQDEADTGRYGCCAELDAIESNNDRPFPVADENEELPF